MVKGYSPNEEYGEKRDRFWIELVMGIDYAFWNMQMDGFEIRVLLEFQKIMIMVEEWWSSVLKGDFM